MITIPTGDLTGILGDVIPFASSDKDDPILNAVRVEWDGRMAHALATDRYRVAISTWNPHDLPERDTQDDLFTEWGGADDPWAVVVPLDDAKDVVAAYKLGAKEMGVPLTVDVHDYRLKVARSRDTGHSAITMAVEVPMIEWPDVRKLLADNSTVQPFAQLAYTPKLLADFAKVRPRGPMELTFCGEKGFTLVQIGERFSGAIMPVRRNADNEAPKAEQEEG